MSEANQAKMGRRWGSGGGGTGLIVLAETLETLIATLEDALLTILSKQRFQVSV